MDELPALRVLLTGLGLGLMMGLERERRAGTNAGIRTFGLVGLAGTLCALIAQEAAVPWLIPATALGLLTMMIAADLHPADADGRPDTTTTVALLLCFLLAVMLGYGHVVLAVALALGATALLYFKAELHDVTHRLTRQDIVSFLQFAVITFVVLPILPNQGYGPYGRLNPYEIWLMVVLTSGVSLAGYAALRIAPRANLVPVLGLLGGVVSSTATTLVFSRYGRRGTGEARMALVVILLANLVLLLRVALLAGVLSPRLLAQLAPVLAAGLLLGALLPVRAALALAHARGPLPDIGNPVGLRHALLFGAGYAIVLVLASFVHDKAGTAGVYTLAFLSGLADMDAITISTLRLHAGGQLAAAEACWAIVAALGANMILKASLALVLGGRALALGVVASYLMVFAGLAGAAALIA